MSSYDPEHQKDMWAASNSPQNQQPLQNIDLRAITAQVWLSLICIWIAKIMVAFMMGASFSVINPIAKGVYLADFIPLPTALEDIQMGAVINGGLGFATVLIPTILWKYILSDEFQCNPQGFFLNQPIRVAVGIVLMLSYLMLIALEVMALRSRIHASLSTGPIQIVNDQPEALPMIVASIAMILGTIMLGLASAHLSKSIAKRFSVTR